MSLFINIVFFWKETKNIDEQYSSRCSHLSFYFSAYLQQALRTELLDIPHCIF